jgi:polyphosphate kinase 2 (PPK2 family)
MVQNVLAARSTEFSPFGNFAAIEPSGARTAVASSRSATQDYQLRLRDLQEKLRLWHEQVYQQEHRIIILLEGRDTAGKGGSAKRILEALDPKASRGVEAGYKQSLSRTFDEEFYLNNLPEPGHVVVLDGGWYSAEILSQLRGVSQHGSFAATVDYFEKIEVLITKLGVTLLKYWFRSNTAKHADNAECRQNNPSGDTEDLISNRWRHIFAEAEGAFYHGNMASIPWTGIEVADRRSARLSCIEHLASRRLNDFG